MKKAGRILALSLLGLFLFKDVMRKKIDTNKKLEVLRRISKKTFEQQKEFIDLKYPKKQRFVFTWRKMYMFAVYILSYIVIFALFNKLMNYYQIIIPLWLGITLLILFPIVFNRLMKKFYMEQNDSLF